MVQTKKIENFKTVGNELLNELTKNIEKQFSDEQGFLNTDLVYDLLMKTRGINNELIVDSFDENIPYDEPEFFVKRYIMDNCNNNSLVENNKDNDYVIFIIDYFRTQNYFNELNRKLMNINSSYTIF